RPVAAPSRARYDDGAFRNRSVRLLPTLQVRRAQPVIAVTGARAGDVNYDSRRDELRKRNLFRGGLTLTEVDRAVDVGAEMLAAGIVPGGVPVAFGRHPPAFPLELEWFRRRPVDGFFVEVVGEVDHLRYIDERPCLRGQGRRQRKDQCAAFHELSPT